MQIYDTDKPMEEAKKKIRTQPIGEGEALIKDRFVPYKLLAYLLYAEERTWIEPLGNNKVRLNTADAARFLHLKNSLLWEAVYWLEKYKLVSLVEKEQKRGFMKITLRPLNRDFPE